MSVAEEDISNDVRRIAVNDLIEKIGRVGQGVRAIPATDYVSVRDRRHTSAPRALLTDVTNNPHSLTTVFGLL